MNPEERIQKAKDVTQSRILSQEEFRQIRVRQLAKQMGPDSKQGTAAKKGKKRKRSEVTINETEE